MGFTRIFSIFIFALLLWFVSLFFTKSAFADQPLDFINPTIAATVTCGTDTLTAVNGGTITCSQSSANLSIVFSDNQGLSATSSAITTSPTVTCNPTTLSTDPNNPTASQTCTTSLTNSTSSYTISANAADFALNPASISFTLNFTYSVSGSIYIDTNGDGSLSAGETTKYTGSCTISAGSGTPSCSSGDYSILGLSANTTYSVTLSGIASGYTITTTNPLSVPVVTANVTGRNFGVVQFYTLSGTVYNGASVYDSSISVLVYTYVPGDTVGTSHTVTYPSNGTYQATNLIADNYLVTLTVPSNFKITTSGGACYTSSWDPNPSCVGGLFQIWVNNVTSPSNKTRDFNIVPVYTISGNIYRDINSNDTYNSGTDTAFTDASIVLNISGTAPYTASSSTTDGSYTVSNVVSGTYSISVDTPTNFKGVINFGNAYQNFTVGANVTGINFLVLTYKITGNVFIDNDHNSSYTAGDSYTSKTINLTGTSSDSKDSDAVTGTYSFVNLITGTYTVALTIPANYQATKPTSTTTPSGTCSPTTCMSPGTTSYSITLGPDATGKDFGISPLYSIEGDIYEDTNGDGVKITGGVSDPFFNGGIVLSCSGPTACTSTVTAGAHHYTTGALLLSGTYTITIDSTPTGYKTVTPVSISVTVPPSATNQDFLVIGYKITGTVFVDYNHDQVWQATESAYTSLASPTIYVGDASSSATVSYPGNGVFKSVNLTLRQYWVTIYVPLGYKLTTRNPSVVLSDSGTCYDPSTTPWTWLGSPGYSLCDGGKAYQTTFTITSTTGDIAIDFGITPLYTLSGNIYEDLNGTGAYDSTPTPADALFTNPPTNTKSIVITLSGGSSNTATTTTGAYSFTNLISGSYSITANSTPTGYKQVLYIGTLTRPFSVNADITGINFLVQGFTISGNVFVDYNHDGTKDVDDTNYSGATLSITNSITNTCPGEKTTNTSGNYSFVNLTTGTYSVRLCVPSGYQATTTNPVPLTISTLDATADFGITVLYAISGNVFVDINKDEVLNPGEQPYTLSNSIIEAHSGNDPACAPGTLATNIGSGGTITTSDGTYTTGQNLLSGEYTFCYKSIPSNYWPTYPKTGSPPSLSVTVGTPGKSPPCSVGALRNASCDAIGNVVGLDFGITNSCQWAQFIGADARGHLGVGSCDPFPPASGGGIIVDPIPNPPIPDPPSSPAACGSPLHASTNDGINTSPGVFFAEDNSYSFCQSGAVGCQSQASTQGWVVGGTTNPEVYQAQNPNTLRVSYDAMVTTARQNGTNLIPLTTTQCSGADITASCDLSTTTLDSGIYRADSNLTLINSNNCSIANPSDLRSSQGCYKFPSNKQIVIMVNGNLYINENILVPTNTSVTFSVKGNITVDQNIGVNYNTSCDLTTADHTGCNIEGFYNADQSFIVNGNSGAQTVCATGANDKRLNIAGSVVTGANLADSGSIIVKRDLCKKNLQCPTYTITARPDFIINAPEFIRHPNFIWREEAP